jgi:CRP-like cAMP-binding protein
MTTVRVGDTLHAPRARIKDVYFPNGGAFSVTNEMRNGALVEVATVGREGMLGIGVLNGDRAAAGRTFQQVANGRLPSMSATRFVEETATAGPFREVVSRYAQANLLQIMQCAACNALHSVTQRSCRWLLQTHDRVDGDTFALKQEFLAVMLGVQRPTVSVVLRTLQRAGAISSRYGQIRILERRSLEAAACECYEVIRAHFARLGL